MVGVTGLEPKTSTMSMCRFSLKTIFNFSFLSSSRQLKTEVNSFQFVTIFYLVLYAIVYCQCYNKL